MRATLHRQHRGPKGPKSAYLTVIWTNPFHEEPLVTYVTDLSQSRPINERYISVIFEMTLASHPDLVVEMNLGTN